MIYFKISCPYFCWYWNPQNALNTANFFALITPLLQSISRRITMLISLEENNIKELRVIIPSWIETQYIRKCPEGRFSEIHSFFSRCVFKTTERGPKLDFKYFGKRSLFFYFPKELGQKPYRFSKCTLNFRLV